MRILVTGHVFYHIDNAAKFRVLEVVQAFQSMGHEVVVFDGLSPIVATPYGDQGSVRLERWSAPHRPVDKLIRKLGIGLGILSHPVANERFDAVYCYGSELSWLIAARIVARRSGARLIVDVTELYGFEEMFSSFSAFRTRISGWLGVFPGIPLLASAIAVPSRRFQRLFRFFGRSAQLLPPFFGEIALHQEPASSGVLKLAYAGSPSNKEQMGLIFRALADLPLHDRTAVHFQLVGLGSDDIVAIAREHGVAGLLSRADIRMEARGRTTVDTARSIISDADFGIVIRRQSLRVNFGFPSKVAEAFRLGTPVISNFYSDIALYLRDAVNGLALREDSPEALRQILLRCLAMTHIEKQSMRQNASQTGSEMFSRERGAATLGELLGS